MPRESRFRRPTRADAPLTGRAKRARSVEAPHVLVGALARGGRVTDVLPLLHRQALAATGGSCSLLFERGARNAILHATSGYGLEALSTEPWMPSDRELDLATRAFEQATPILVTDLDRQMPDLAARLARDCALLVPLLRGADRLGLLAVGFDQPPQSHALLRDVTDAADAFRLSLELFRLRQNEEVRADVRDLLEAFDGSLSGGHDLATSLQPFCAGAVQLFGADRASVWLHDRRKRRLTLEASSDPSDLVGSTPFRAADAVGPSTDRLSRSRAAVMIASTDPSAQSAVIPLLGYRRALGSLALDGVRIAPGAEHEWLDRAEEVGRRLSSAIEATQLLEDVVRTRRELNSTLDAIDHLVVVIDRQGRIIETSETFARRVGATGETLIDRPIASCVGAELASRLSEIAGRSGAGHAPVLFEVNDPVVKGTLTVTATALLDREGRQAGTVVVASDRTSPTALEAERAEFRRRLGQSEKLAALGQFVAGVAHELNNPLQSVLGHLELLRATGAFPPQLRSDVQTIYREADRAARTVRNLLIFTGSQPMSRRLVSLNALIQRVTRLRQSTCRAQNIEIVRHYDEKLPRVKSDPLLLHQVFLNMVMNAEQAISATGRPGRIEITTALNGGDRLVATVRDSGDGIAAEALPHIFEPFYTTRDVGKGPGLGLAIVYGIVQDHGGHIAAANHPDGGAIFTVELPCGPPA